MFKRFWEKNRFVNRWRISWRTKRQFYKQISDEVKNEEIERKNSTEFRKQYKLDKIGSMMIHIFIIIACIWGLFEMLYRFLAK